MRKAVYNHIVRVLLDGAPDGTLDRMLRRTGCTDLVKLRRFIRQPHYHQWLDTQEIYLTDDQYQGLHGLESYLNYVQNYSGPISDGYADITKNGLDYFLDYCYELYTTSKPITYDEERAIKTKEHRGGYVPDSLIKVPDLYGIEYSGDDHTPRIPDGHHSDSMGSNKHVGSIISGNKSNIKDHTDQDSTGGMPRVPTKHERTPTNNDGSTSAVKWRLVNGTLIKISDKVQSGKEDCNSSSVDTIPSGTCDTCGHTHNTSMIDDSGKDTGIGNNDSSVLEVSFDDKNISDTAFQPTPVESSLKSSTDDPDIAYLDKLLRTTRKHIKRSIAKHITGSSRDYPRAVSICNPSVIIIQRYVRHYLVTKSIITNKRNVKRGTSGSILRMDDSTTGDGNNLNEHVITPSSSLSSHTTTDASTDDSQAFTQHQESTTSFVTYYAEDTLTSSYVHPWGALLSDLLSANTTSTPYQDTFEYTATTESEEQCGTRLDMYVHPTGNKLGESTLCTFLVKDWQWIDIMARKYGTRAFWYGISSDGYQDGTSDGDI